MEQSDYFIPPKVHQKIEICLNNTSDISDLASNLSSNNSSLGNISFEMDTSSGLPNINQFLNDNFVNDYLSKDKIPEEVKEISQKYVSMFVKLDIVNEDFSQSNRRRMKKKTKEQMYNEQEEISANKEAIELKKNLSGISNEGNEGETGKKKKKKKKKKKNQL